MAVDLLVDIADIIAEPVAGSVSIRPAGGQVLRRADGQAVAPVYATAELGTGGTPTSVIFPGVPTSDDTLLHADSRGYVLEVTVTLRRAPRARGGVERTPVRRLVRVAGTGIVNWLDLEDVQPVAPTGYTTLSELVAAFEASVAPLAADADGARAAAQQAAADAQTALQAQFATQDTGTANLLTTSAGPATQAALFGTVHSWSATQAFKPTAKNNPTNPSLTVGPDLAIYEADGNAGQRFALTGTNGDVMPYFEVVANTRTGTDGGNAVAGYQLHLGPDGGHGINREFLYIEAAGEKDVTHGPHFRIGVHASGAGVRRPLWIESMGSAAMIFDTDISIKLKQPLKSDTQQRPLQMTSTASNLTAISGVAYRGALGASPAPQTFLGMAEGTPGAGAAPSAVSVSLGGHAFGSKNGSATVIAADVRALTTEAWTFGSNQGTALDFRITPAGTSAVTRAMLLTKPLADQYTSMVLLCQIGGVTSAKNVRLYNDGTRNLLYV